APQTFHNANASGLRRHSRSARNLNAVVAVIRVLSVLARPATFGFVLNLSRPRGRLANRCIPSTVWMLCPAAPSMTVPTVVIMPKKKRTARATAENESSKKGRSDHDFHIDAGYTYPEHCIDELLELAGADRSPRSRRDLLNALQLAQIFY